MIKIIRGSHWLISLTIFLMPVVLVFFLGSQMAYGQVAGQFRDYQALPEVGSLAALADLPAGQVVLLRGNIAPAVETSTADLLVYQVRPAVGREVRFGEEFPLVFPAVNLTLPDGAVSLNPSLTRDRIIQAERHSVAAGDYRYTGFRAGDPVLVQGQWQPQAEGLVEVTGLTGGDRASLMADWQRAFKLVSAIRNGLGLLTLLGVILLGRQLYQAKHQEKSWQTPTNPTMPTTI